MMANLLVGFRNEPQVRQMQQLQSLQRHPASYVSARLKWRAANVTPVIEPLVELLSEPAGRICAARP